MPPLWAGLEGTGSARLDRCWLVDLSKGERTAGDFSASHNSQFGVPKLVEDIVAPVDLVLDTMSESESVAGSCEAFLRMSFPVMSSFHVRSEGGSARFIHE